MPDRVKPIPDGYQGATPYLRIKGAAAALEFYKKAFGAVETMRLADPSGQIGHAEIRIGQAPVMLADEYPEMGMRGPQSLGGTTVAIHVYVEDVDRLAERAVAAGAKLLRPVENQFYGDRACSIVDPFGHEWLFATHQEDVPPAEMERRAAALFGGK